MGAAASSDDGQEDSQGSGSYRTKLDNNGKASRAIEFARMLADLGGAWPAVFKTVCGPLKANLDRVPFSLRVSYDAHASLRNVRGRATTDAMLATRPSIKILNNPHGHMPISESTLRYPLPDR